MGWRDVSGDGGERRLAGAWVGWSNIVISKFLWLGGLDGGFADSCWIVDTRDSCVMNETSFPRISLPRVWQSARLF